MNRYLAEIFEDEELKAKMRSKLPYLFVIAELESSRAAMTRTLVNTQNVEAGGNYIDELLDGGRHTRKLEGSL